MSSLRLSLGLAACVLALTAQAAPAQTPAPTPAPAGERLTAAEIQDIARREMLLCENYVASSDDCDIVTLWRLTGDGAVAETSTLLVSDEPQLQVYIADSSQIRGDAICSQVDLTRTAFSFTLNGQPAPPATSAALQLLFLAQLAELNGKTMCQSFIHGDQPGVLIEEITVDGQRRTDLESTYILREGTERLKLRPQADSADEGTTQL